MIDDSGSMDADLTTPEGALVGVGGSEGLMPIDAGGSAYYGYMYATYAADNAYTYSGTWVEWFQYRNPWIHRRRQMPIFL